MTLSGVGGAFGGREDLSMQIHACLLALRTGKPVKIVYNRFESFFGHVHRHPAKLCYEHGATRDGKLRHVKCRIVLDGGAYASTSPAVVGNAASARHRPVRRRRRRHRGARALHQQPALRRDARLRRGPGLLRLRGADGQARRRARAWTRSSSAGCNAMEQGTAHADRPGRRLARRRSPNCCAGSRPCRCRRSAVATAGERRTSATLPGGLSNTTHGEGVVRGVGYAVGIKNVGFSEGFDDYSTARVRLEVIGGEPVATVHTAMAEVGQGGVTVHAQIARTELGVAQVTIHPADTQVGSRRFDLGLPADVRHRRRGASTPARPSASRSWSSAAASSARTTRPGPPPSCCWRAARSSPTAARCSPTWSTCSATRPSTETVEWRHRPTEPFDLRDRPGRRPRPVRLRRAPRGRRGRHRTRPGQGRRAGLRPGRRQGAQPAVRRRPDPGRHHPGPRAGGDGGDRRRPGTAKVRNPSFTDYLIPTILDTPTIPVDVLEPRRARPVRAARRRRGADPLLHPGRPRPRSGPRPAWRSPASRYGRSTSPAPEPRSAEALGRAGRPSAVEEASGRRAAGRRSGAARRPAGRPRSGRRPATPAPPAR